MDRQDPVGSICRPYNSSGGDAEVPNFIRRVGGQEPQIHEVWAFVDDGAMREVHLTARVDVGDGVFGEFSSDHVIESGTRIPILSRVSINGSVELLGVPEFHRNGGPFWTTNLLSPHPSWVNGGTITNKNRISQPGITSGSVAVPWNCPVCVLPVYVRRLSENTRAAVHCVRDDQIRSNHMALMHSPSTSSNPIQNPPVNQQNDDWESSVDQ